MRDATRRELLRLAGLGLGLGLGWFPRRAWAQRTSDPRLAACLRLLPDPVSTAAVGRAYLERVPAERDAIVLLERLAIPTSLLPGGQEATLRRWFRRRIRRDFEAGRIVEVEGWILARTEARLCGLVTASRPRAW